MNLPAKILKKLKKNLKEHSYFHYVYFINLSSTAIEPGNAAEARKTHKLIKYEELKSNYIVIPVAIESFGPWDPMGLKLIKEFSKKKFDLTGEKDQLPTYSSLFKLQLVKCGKCDGNSLQRQKTRGRFTISNRNQPKI